jgi:hypothetical protein
VNNNQVRCSANKFLEVLSVAGAKPAGVYVLLVGWTHLEVQDPSDPSKRLGIVQPAWNTRPRGELVAAEISAATNGKVLENTIEWGLKKLHEHKFIAVLRLPYGQKIVVRDSEKFLFDGYIVNKAPAWVYEISEFENFKPSRPSRNSWDHGKEIPIQSGSDTDSVGIRKTESGSRGTESGSDDSGGIKNQQDSLLGGFRKYIGEKEEVSRSLLSTENGQGVVSKDARSFARRIGKEVQKLAPSVVILPTHYRQLERELINASLCPLPTLDELVKAAISEATDWGTDQFKIGQGANLLIGKLLNSVEIAREHKEDSRRTTEMVRICTENERRKAEHQRQELAARESAELELVEETLPGG